jgi:hypothetical protein
MSLYYVILNNAHEVAYGNCCKGLSDSPRNPCQPDYGTEDDALQGWTLHRNLGISIHPVGAPDSEAAHTLG